MLQPPSNSDDNKCTVIILEHSVSQHAALRETIEIVVRLQQKHLELQKLSNFLAI